MGGSGKYRVDCRDKSSLAALLRLREKGNDRALQKYIAIEAGDTALCQVLRLSGLNEKIELYRFTWAQD